MLLGLLAGVLAAWMLGDFSAVFAAPSEMLGVVAAAVVICAVGVIDDVRPLSAPAKVAGMVLSGSVLSLSGVSLVVLRIPFLDVVLLSPDFPLHAFEEGTTRLLEFLAAAHGTLTTIYGDRHDKPLGYGELMNRLVMRPEEGWPLSLTPI